MENKNNLPSINDINVSQKDTVLKWCKPGHASVAEVIYNAFPKNIKTNLDVEAMIDGSNDPDEKFKDTATHHYPASYKRAIKWLNDGKLNYDSKNYKRSSYCFGVASHYISDTFSAPHCVKGEPNKVHHKFEIVDDDYTPNVEFISGDLETLMKKGNEQGKIDWKNWEKTKNPSIPHTEADIGASVAYSAIKNILS